MRAKNLFVVIFLFFFFFIKTDIFAQRGCCSHHGGIAYCGNGGYYICNDGTRSSTCTCFNYYDDSEYIFTQPKIYTIPDDTMLHSTFYKGTKDKTCGVLLNWDRPEGHFSVGLSKTAFADPGPLVDTDIPEYFFDNIYPGVWNFNAKEWYDNQWSRVTSWEIVVENCGDITYAQHKLNLEIEEHNRARVEKEKQVPVHEVKINREQTMTFLGILDGLGRFLFIFFIHTFVAFILGVIVVIFFRLIKKIHKWWTNK